MIVTDQQLDAQAPPGRDDEYRALSLADRRVLTPDVVTRWSSALADDDVVSLAEIARLERQRRQALDTLRDGVELTDQEFRLLRLLQRREGRTVTMAEIIRHLWPDDARRASDQQLWDRHGAFARRVRSLHAIMHHIRRKLEIDLLRPQHLVSIRSIGYRWYSAPPSRDDGEDYAARADDAREWRYRIRGYRGELPPPRTETGRFRIGPAHPDSAAIDADVTARRSRRPSTP